MKTAGNAECGARNAELSILTGDCRELLKTLPDESVQCCVTSPPYWGLRDYGMIEQIGQEATPEQFVETMVKVFREVRRVLKADGTCWLNLGDSYAGTGKSGGGAQGKRWEECGMDTTGPKGGKWMPPPNGLKQKDLVGIPWRVAFALQADGWWLRQDIIWHKPNPMPESVTDRCTKAHEYIFLLTKSERYFYDAEAIKEQAVCGWNDSEFDTGKTGAHQLGRSQKRESRKRGEFQGKTNAMEGREAFRAITESRNKRSVWTVTTKPYKGAHFATYPPELIAPCILAGSRVGDVVLDPFGGSGTTGQVALELGRRAVLCELNPDYVTLIRQRCDTTPGLPLEVAK